MDEMLVRAFIKSLVMPPTINIVVIVGAFLLLRRWRVFQFLVITLSLLSLLLLSLPSVSYFLASQLERYPALVWQEINPEDYQAIVVLGSGRHRQALEYDGLDVPRTLGLERLRYAAYLQRKTGLPIMVTGGAWMDDSVPEAAFMARVLENDFNSTVKWQEKRSRTTWENALYSKRLAEQNGVERVLLVTHAWHMLRAVYSFEKAGLNVTPAPTMFKSSHFSGTRFSDFVPNMNSLQSSTYMLHEMLGVLWYRFS